MAALSSHYEEGLKLSSRGRHLEAIGCFETALATQPQDTRVLFALGNTARALGLAHPAQDFFRKVLALEPERLEALVNLANLLRVEGRFDAALALLEPAAARNLASPEINLTLGSVHRDMGDHAAAERCYAAALAADPNYAPALSNMADMAADKGDFDSARTLYGQALKADPGNAQARLNRAVLNLLAGDLKSGWRDYAARTEIAGKVPAANLKLAPWTGGPLKRTRLLVRSEQGVGDQIMFASVIPDLAARAARDGGSIILECEPRLATLYERSFPGVTVMPAIIRSENGTVTAHYDGLKAAGGANAVTLMGSLPKYLRGAIGDFPVPKAFLVPDAEEAARWRNIFSTLGGPVTGICWRSGKTGGHRAVQYAPLAAWAGFIKSAPGSFVSAQYDATPDEIAELERLSGRKIFVPEGLDQKNELDRAAAMLSSLDRLVSAPTAVSWLGAAVGTPTFKILYDTSWTAFGETHEPFAPSCICVMPATRGDWADAFNRVPL